MVEEVGLVGFLYFEVFLGGFMSCGVVDFVSLIFVFVVDIGFDIFVGLFDIMSDIKGVVRGFGDG